MSLRYALECDRCGHVAADTEAQINSSGAEVLRRKLATIGWSRRARLKLTKTTFSKKETDDLCPRCTETEPR